MRLPSTPFRMWGLVGLQPTFPALIAVLLFKGESFLKCRDISRINSHFLGLEDSAHNLSATCFRE